MPNPGTVNNPSGTNSFDRFAPEPAYGEATKQDALQRGAPLAGGRLAAGAIAAPKQAQRKAQRPAPPAQGPPPIPQRPAVMSLSPQETGAQTWAQIASAPGAENWPELQLMAELATR